MTQNFVQGRYTDNFDRGFAGQIFNPNSIDGNAAFSYPASEDVYIGRAVASEALQDPNNVASGVAIKPVNGISAPGQMVGIVISDKQALVDSNGNAYIPAGKMATVMRLGRGGLIYVKVAVSVAQDDAVYVATAAVNNASIAVGEFTNISGTGLLDTGLRFFKGAAAGNAAVIDTINTEG